MDVRTALGVLTGLVASLALALLISIASNGRDIPGIALAGSSAAAGASAPAPAPAPRSVVSQDSFQSLDLNADGRISLAEAAGYGDVITRFHRGDRNKDGKLTKAEFERMAKLPPPKERPKPKLRLREDAAASLSAARREGQ